MSSPTPLSSNHRSPLGFYMEIHEENPSLSPKEPQPSPNLNADRVEHSLPFVPSNLIDKVKAYRSELSKK